MSQNTSGEEARVVPAKVNFLAIYNPTLGPSDETLEDQLIYYYGCDDRRRRDKINKQKDNATESDETKNERLRQIGLAQGMVSFANNFSSSSVNSIETEKNRVVLHELEKNWWILASIDLTRLPASKISREDSSGTAVECSAREVAPAQLLITQLVQANSIFLLHHATKLQDLFERAGRSTFCSLLERYWNKFLRRWDVLLHGNPAVEIFRATKLSGGGELGIGVGEEDWGSGEREVLEGFVDRTTGLRDLIVGRYGLPPDTDRAQNTADSDPNTNTWLGTGNHPAAADGIIFLGKGLVSKRSLYTISQWMESIFMYGDEAYGVGENPSSRPRPKRKRRRPERTTSPEVSTPSPIQELNPMTKSIRKRAPNLRKKAIENNATPPGIPAPLVSQVEQSLDQALAEATKKSSNQNQAIESDSADQESSTFGTENMMKYLTLGYGTTWTLNPKGLKSDGSERKPDHPKSDGGGTPIEEEGMREVEPAPEISEDEKPFRQKLEQSIGKFLIGLSGDLEQTELEIEAESDPDSAEPRFADNRLFLRTLTIEMRQPENQKRNTTIRSHSAESMVTGSSNTSAKGKPPTSAGASIDGAQPNVTHEKVQVAIYVHQPFMFVFLFELHSLNLTIPSFYRNIHSQLGPLQKPLLRSTDPGRVAERIANAMGEKSGVTAFSDASQATNPIYDLVYDSSKRTVRTSIPNIPIPGSLAAEGLTSNVSSTVSVSGSWYTLGIPIGSSSSPTTNKPSDKLIKSSWSRTEALNAHTQILHTYLATRSGSELEHTAKTSRGWWVLWMKIPPPRAPTKDPDHLLEEHRPSQHARGDSEFTGPNHREAFLVRKAADFRQDNTKDTRIVSTGPGRWLLREQKRDVSGASSASGGGGSGAASAKGVSEGVGVDARKWVEGLLTLTQ